MNTCEHERPKGFPVEQWERPCKGCKRPWFEHQFNGTPACNHFSFSDEGAKAARFWDAAIKRLGLR